jgi:hypothetical protein
MRGQASDRRAGKTFGMPLPLEVGNSPGILNLFDRQPAFPRGNYTRGSASLCRDEDTT